MKREIQETQKIETHQVSLDSCSSYYLTRFVHENKFQFDWLEGRPGHLMLDLPVFGESPGSLENRLETFQATCESDVMFRNDGLCPRPLSEWFAKSQRSKI